MKKTLFYMILLWGLTACGAKPPSEQMLKITRHVEKIAQTGQIDLRNIGREEAPLWLASHNRGGKKNSAYGPFNSW